MFINYSWKIDVCIADSVRNVSSPFDVGWGKGQVYSRSGQETGFPDRPDLIIMGATGLDHSSAEPSGGLFLAVDFLVVFFAGVVASAISPGSGHGPKGNGFSSLL